MNSVRLATEEEVANWDSYLQKNPGPKSFFQESQFLQFKSRQRISPWTIRYVVHTIDGLDIYVGYLVKRIFGLGEYWYAPFGPQITRGIQVDQMITQLQQIASRAFIVLLEPTLLVTSKEDQEMMTEKIKGAQITPPIQPNVHTVVVPTQDSQALFTSLKQRTRRAIRQAEKANVQIRKVSYSDETKKQFFAMYRETSQRANFFIREEEYYEEFWSTYHQAGQGDFFFAYVGDATVPVAGAFILYDTKKALYKDGASIRGGLPGGTLHLLHWKIIEWLEKHGIEEYDLHGVPASWLQEDKNHRQYGLGIFKSSFGTTTDYVGALQWNLKPIQTGLWNKGVRKIYYTFASRRGGFFF